MKPVGRKYGFYLEDMLTSMERIEEYITDLDFTQFKMQYLIVDAVIRNFEVIGEASKHIPSEIVEKYPEIPWRKMYLCCPIRVSRKGPGCLKPQYLLKLKVSLSTKDKLFHLRNF